MQVINWSRIKGSSCLLAMLVSGLFTNCTCGHAKNNNPGITVDSSNGDTEPVAACGANGSNPLWFQHQTGDMSMCAGSCTAAAATTSTPLANCLPITENQMRICPDDGTSSIAKNTPFDVYWTITSISDTDILHASDVQAYTMVVSQINADNSETQLMLFNLTQPQLASCNWQDVGFGFNNSNGPSRVLAPGKYSFRLTGIYDSKSDPKGSLATAPETITILP